MKTIWLVSLLLCSRLLAASDPASLAAELRHLGAQIDQGQAASVLAALPPAWEVDTGSGRHNISTAPLRKLLMKPATDAGRAKAWLEYLAAHLDGFATAPRAPRDASAKLERILARREFAGIGPPSAWELLRQRIAAWVQNLLRRIFARIPTDSTAGAILTWMLLAGGVGALGCLLVLMWKRDDRAGLLPADSLRARARTSLDWIRAAREAAAQRDWRRAVQCAYWAGIVGLEETGALPSDRTRTPREYLRLLAPSSPNAASPFAAPLAALTARLERFWYARSSAGADDFAACLDSLEALGCQVK